MRFVVRRVVDVYKRQVLHNGSAIEMPWVNDVPAVLELYLAGDGAGEGTY